MVATCLSLLVACEASRPPLVLESVRPNLVASDRETALLLEGSFYVPVGADLSSGQQLLMDEFEVELGGIPLVDVELISENELTAVIPAAFPVGDHDLSVRDSLERQDLLPRAIRVLPSDSSSPRVVILSPSEEERFFPGELIVVLYYVVDNPPGRVTAVEWLVSGAVEAEGNRRFTTPLYEYYGTLELDAPVECDDRDLAVLLLAEDDAPNPNLGTARLDLVLDCCRYFLDCDDGLFCNGQEWCDDGGCMPGEIPDCSDGVFCTSDLCDEASRQCVHVPDDAACDDGRFCTGEEICDPDIGCVSAGSPCDDGIECTVDICDDGDPGECRVIPVDELCHDDVYCNGAEACLPGYGCVAGTDPCEDPFECTTSFCFEDGQRCEVELDHELCADDDPCTVDRCVKGEGCVYVSAEEGPRGHPSCDDGVDNDCDGLIDDQDSECSD